MDRRNLANIILTLSLPAAVIVALLSHGGAARDAVLLALLGLAAATAALRAGLPRLAPAMPQHDDGTFLRIARTLFVGAALLCFQIGFFVWLKEVALDRSVAASFFSAGLFSGAVGFGEEIYGCEVSRRLQN